jgi:hypothetical protein
LRPDAQPAPGRFRYLMGQDVSGRRDFIVTNSGLIGRERIDA